MIGLRRRTVRSVEPLREHIKIPRTLWQEILAELHTRGCGVREAGAFLLALRPTEGREQTCAPTVVAAAYYDDLDPACLTGGITMSGTAYDRLWQRCREEGVRVVADVHTHPGEWIGQSHTDRANPMMAWAGHLALIVGAFADRSRTSLPVGLYKYLGGGVWETLLSEPAVLYRQDAQSGIRHRMRRLLQGMRLR